MAHLHDGWLSKDNNLELWTAAADFPAWRKRVLITWLAARAWENVCMRFDFEAAATRLGMRMTIDGSGDELIRMQGVVRYSFCDDDGGDSDCESEVGGGRDARHAAPCSTPRTSHAASNAHVTQHAAAAGRHLHRSDRPPHHGRVHDRTRLHDRYGVLSSARVWISVASARPSKTRCHAKTSSATKPVLPMASWKCSRAFS